MFDRRGLLCCCQGAEGEFEYLLFIILSLERCSVEFYISQYALQKGRTVGLAAPLSNDKQTADSTREGYIQQVQVIHRVLQVLIQEGLLIDGASHLFPAIVDGCYRQGIERRCGGFAPQDVGHLQFPVAEGDDDMIELQSFTFVNGQDADAAVRIALYGLAANGFFPFADKGIDVRRVVLRKLVQLVVERTDIGTLFIQVLKTEDGIQAFYEFEERQLLQFLSMLDECFGQEFVKLPVLDEQFLLGNVFAEDGKVVELGNGSLGQEVVRMGNQMECLNQEAY